MRESDFTEKVKVFISSNIDAKHILVREALRLLLLQTCMCDVYSFEEEPATSTDVVSSYLYKIERADLIVFLINNADGINKGTLKEVKRSRELKKKCIFIFCNETKKEKTELQKEIMSSPTGEKYKEVPLFSHMAGEAYRSVLADIVDIYLQYCRNSFQLVASNQLQNSEDQEKELVSINSVLNKETYHNHEYLNSIVITYALYNKPFSEECSDFDSESGKFLELLLGNTRVSNIDFMSLKRVILERHSSGNLKKIVSHRLDALESYFRGNIEDAITHLVKALEKAQKAKNIPKWIENDIAIDLRNTTIMLNQYNNIVASQIAGQDVLDNSEEPVYFPVVDRAASSFYENAFNDSFQEKMESPFVVKIGGIDQCLSSIVDLYVVALLYGAITHITRVRVKLCKYLQYLSLKNRNHYAFVSAVEMLLLIGNNKDLESYVNSYGESTDSIADTDVLRWKNAVESIGIKHKRLNSEILLLSTFGYYFSDALFSDSFEDVKARVRVWTDDCFAGDLIAKAYLKMLISVQNRINPKELIDTAYMFKQKNLRRWYDDVFRMLCSLTINGLKQDVLEKYISWLTDCCTDTTTNKNYYLPEAIQRIRLQIKESESLDKAVQETFPTYFDNTYSLNVFEHNEEERILYISKQISSIMLMNEEQGKNGHYIGYGFNPFNTLGNIFRENHRSISDNEINKICNAILATLNSDKQTFDAKISAITLLIEIAIFKTTNESVKKALDMIKKDKERLQKGTDFLLSKGYSERLYRCIFEILYIVSGTISEIDLVQYLAIVSSLEESETILYLQSLRHIMDDLAATGKQINGICSLLQYLFEVTKSHNKIIRRGAFICMMCIIKVEPMYTDVILDVISRAMDSETYEIKVAILTRVMKMNQENPKVAYIIAKGKVDNHYYVRKIANE